MVIFLLCFFGNGGGGVGIGVGVIFGEGHRSLFFLPVLFGGVAGGVTIFGVQRARLADLYLFTFRVELWSFPLLGSLFGWVVASSSADLDSCSGVLPSVAVPPSSMVQR